MSEINLTKDPYALNSRMEFDHVIRVHVDGTVTDETIVHMPEIHDGELQSLDSRWQLMTGYTGQYSYNGPIMHASEFVGGRLAKDILATPGLYVTLVDYPSDDSEPEGWAVATIPGTPAEHAAHDLGVEHGKNAAEWWQQDAIGGRTFAAQAVTTARRIVQGLDDGDPEILDSLPSADLSGEWADGVSPRDIAEHVEIDDNDPDNADFIDELCDAYEQSFNNTVMSEVERMCRAILPSGDNWTDYLA